MSQLFLIVFYLTLPSLYERRATAFAGHASKGAPIDPCTPRRGPRWFILTLAMVGFFPS